MPGSTLRVVWRMVGTALCFLSVLTLVGCSEGGSADAFCETLTEGPAGSGFDDVGRWRQELADSAPSDLRGDVLIVLAHGVDQEADEVWEATPEHEAAEARVEELMADECGWVDGNPPGDEVPE